jgi:hypothetical protein
MAAAALAAASPVCLVGMAMSVIAIRLRCGSCRARPRWAWVRAATLARVEGE